MEREEFRTIYVKLLDSPEFLELSALARAGWFTLKLRLGKYGIASYPVQRLAKDMHCSVKEAAAAVTELSTPSKADGKPWLYVQGPLMWLRNGWKFEPYCPPTSRNHREGALKWLAKLPKANLTLAFARYYGLPNPYPSLKEDLRELFPEGIPEGIGEVFPEGFMEGFHPHRITEETELHRTSTTTTTDSPPISPSRGNEQGGRVSPRQGLKLLPEDYAAKEGHLALAIELKQDLDLCVDEMRDWAKAKRMMRADWDAVLRNWIRRRAAEQARWRKDGGNGSGKTPVGTRSANGEYEFDGTRWRKL